MKIRIAVAVDPQGRWIAGGWQGLAHHDDLLEIYGHDTIGPNEKLYWVTADVEAPEATVVEGKVEGA